jgi:prepilin-type N-terminal cleavage/methylation domain-containing protein
MLRSRPGFSLAETLISLAIMGIMGVALTRLLVTQSQFFNEQGSQMNARSVSRSATSLVIQELRMLDVGGGVVAAARDSITIRVPYRMGIICASAAATTASFLPVDSSMNAMAGFSGYAWRDSTTGAYTYQEIGVSTTAGSAATCTTNNITTIAGGNVLDLSPPAPSAATPATPIFLFQRVTYRFKSSTSVPGAIGLFRRVVDNNTEEELVAPFDTAAKFRFYENSATAQDAVPSPISNMRGVELVLTALNERPRSAATTSAYRTAVWFKNRIN